VILILTDGVWEKESQKNKRYRDKEIERERERDGEIKRGIKEKS